MTLTYDLDPKILKMYGACILEMNFLGQGFQELVSQTDTTERITTLTFAGDENIKVEQLLCLY